MTLPTTFRLAVLCLLACTARGVIAGETTYAFDPEHTRVMFAVSHAGFSDPMFTIAGTSGTLVFDPEDWSRARVEARIPLAGLELAEGRWRSAILGRNFLEAARYPEARFVSTRVEPIDATHATVSGLLTLRDVTHEVKLDVVFHQARRHPLPPFRKTIGFSATGHLSRRLFSVTAWPNVVGDAVEIRIEAEGTHTRDTDATESDEAAATTTMPAPAATRVLPPASEPATPP